MISCDIHINQINLCSFKFLFNYSFLILEGGVLVYNRYTDKGYSILFGICCAALVRKQCYSRDTPSICDS